MLGNLYRHTEIETRHVVFQAEKVRTVMHGGKADSVFVPHGRDDRGPTTAQRMDRYCREALPLATEAVARLWPSRASPRPRSPTW